MFRAVKTYRWRKKRWSVCEQRRWECYILKILTWQTIEKIASCIENLIQRTFLIFFPAGLKYSSIVGNNKNFLTWLEKWLKPVTRQSSYWNRCYHSTVNGWSSFTFHSNCDGKGPTVTIIRVGKYIFGGYTSLSWSKWLQFHVIQQATQARAVSQRCSYCAGAVTYAQQKSQKSLSELYIVVDDLLRMVTCLSLFQRISKAITRKNILSKKIKSMILKVSFLKTQND